MRTLPQPLRLRPFRGLLAAHAINALGNWARQIALWELALSGSQFAIGGGRVYAAGSRIELAVGCGLGEGRGELGR